MQVKYKNPFYFSKSNKNRYFTYSETTYLKLKGSDRKSKVKKYITSARSNIALCSVVRDKVDKKCVFYTTTQQLVVLYYFSASPFLVFHHAEAELPKMVNN